MFHHYTSFAIKFVSWSLGMLNGFGGFVQTLWSSANWVLWTETRVDWQSRWNIAPVMWMGLDVIILPPNNWPVSLKDDTVFLVLSVAGILDTQWWQQLISLRERECMLIRPSHGLHLCHHCFSVPERIAWALSQPTTDPGCCLLAKSPCWLCYLVPLLQWTLSCEHWFMMQILLYVVLTLQLHPNASSMSPI